MSKMTAIYRNFYIKYRDLYGPDTCVLLLVGKFYELYDYIDESGEPLTPIKRVSQIMSLTLKDKDGLGPKGEAGLWSGFPEQSLHKFAQTLTSQGWVVVVVDQVKDIANQVIDRIPTRILSPGTHIETAGQDRLSVAAIQLSSAHSVAKTAVAINDLTTGEVFTFESEQDDDILHMLQVFCVKEVVINDSVQRDTVRSRFGCSVSAVFPNNFAAGESFAREEYFRKMFRVKGLLPVRTALGLDVSELVEGALTTLLRFVEDHFPKETERLTSHTKYSPEGHMRLSNNILEQLNVLTAVASQKSILSMLDRTHSSIGKRALRERILRPVTSSDELEARWKQVEFAHTVESKKVLERDLKGLYDLPRLHFKMAGGSITATDILQLFQTYSSTICLIENLRGTPLECASALESKISEFRSKFKATFDEGKATRRNADEAVGFLTDSAGPETAALEGEAASLAAAWQTTLAAFCKGVGVPLESFSIKTDSDGEYILEMVRNKALEKKLEASKTFLNSKNLLPGFEMDSKKSGPVRITCTDFYTFSQKLRTTVYKMNKSLVKESLVVCDSMWDSVKGFQNDWTAWLGRVDCSFSLAAAAVAYGWCKPSLGEHLDIQGLRHPLLESQQTRAKYVTHDVSLGLAGSAKGSAKARGWLIYGVNASGKSSLMKATGIAVILAQAGSYVPASQMTIRPYDAAFSRIWNQDNIWAGLSSFAVEVKELADILKLSTSRSLVLGDEVCSGTESYSATSLVAATLESLEAKGAHFIFATHLHDLLKVPGLLDMEGISVWHLRVLQEGGKLIYDRSLQPGSGSSSYGLEVAKAMGLPNDLMTRAYAIRRQLGGSAAADEAPRSSWNSAIQRKSCENCGVAIVRDLEVHHIHERAKGGGNHMRNLVVLCEACHDKHHANEIEIVPLTQTSEGLERFSYKPQENARVPVKGFTDVEIETIKATVTNLKGRPAQRIATELQEVHGIRVTVAQLKKFLAP
jgi:DNA mismatch repair protein MutS